MLGHMARMPPSKPSIKTFLQTGGDYLVDLDSPGWLPYTKSVETWYWLGQRSRTCCRSCTVEGADSWRYLVHAIDDESEGSLVRKKCKEVGNLLATSLPNHNPNVEVDFRNKETLNSFSYVHAVMALRNSERTSDPSDQWTVNLSYLWTVGYFHWKNEWM